MKRIDNPELKRRILDHLAELYNIKERREPNHLSSYVYCRTKGFFDQKQTAEPTDEEVMMFALGYGLQDVLTPRNAAAPVYNKHGVIYRPDMSFSIPTAEVEQLVELKTTRKSAKFHYLDEHIPETWMEYMKGGCYIQGTNRYDLAVLYMMGNYSPPFPDIYCDTFEFTQKELDENWLEIMNRKMVLDTALSSSQLPEPFKNCRDWECKYCRYLMVCQTLAPKESPMLEDDKELWQ